MGSFAQQLADWAGSNGAAVKTGGIYANGGTGSNTVPASLSGSSPTGSLQYGAGGVPYYNPTTGAGDGAQAGVATAVTGSIQSGAGGVPYYNPTIAPPATPPPAPTSLAGNGNGNGSAPMTPAPAASTMPLAGQLGNHYAGYTGQQRNITLPDGSQTTYYGFTGDPNDPYGYTQGQTALNPFGGSGLTQAMTNPAAWGGVGGTQQLSMGGLSGTFPVQTFADQQAQTSREMLQMSPGALAGSAQAAANVAAANGGANLIGLGPLGMNAAMYASSHPNAPEVLAAGGFNAFVQKYANSPNPGGFAPASQVPAPDPNAYKPLYSGPTPWNTGGAQTAFTPSALAGSIANIGSAANYPVANGTGQNASQTATTPVTTTTGTPPATQTLAGGQYGVAKTPLGYTTYTGPQAAANNSLSDQQIQALIAAFLASQTKTPTQNSFWGI